MPELRQYAAGSQKYDDLMAGIRNAPDFALVSHDPKEVYLVEVKFRSKIALEDKKKTAAAILDRWKLAWLFFATPDGFFFDKCADLIKLGAKLTPLSTDLVAENLQKKYLKLLNEFISQPGPIARRLSTRP